MNSLPTTSDKAHFYFNLATPLQLVHVYRHVDSANVESSPTMWRKLNESLVAIDIDCSPHASDPRGELSDFDEHEFFGGAL